MLNGYRQLYSIHKTADIYGDIAKYVDGRSNGSNYKLDRPLPKIKNKNVIV